MAHDRRLVVELGRLRRTTLIRDADGMNVAIGACRIREARRARPQPALMAASS
jgi:hypothetical protein